MWRWLLIGCIIALCIPQFTNELRWYKGLADFEGVVTPFPRGNYIIVNTGGYKVAVGYWGDRTFHAGNTVRVRGRYSIVSGSFEWWLRGEGLVGWVNSTSITVVDGSRSWRFFAWLRDYIKDSDLPEIAKGMLLGDRSLVSNAEAYSSLGLAHLLAASGLHLGILVGLVHKLGSKKWTRYLIVLLAIGYICLTGFRISMIRASIMLVLTLCPWRHRLYDKLLIALGIILFIAPYSIYSVSLWMSFGAVFSILSVVPLLRKIGQGGDLFKSKIPVLLQYPLKLLIVTTAAQIGTLVPVLLVFEQLTFPTSILSNLVAIPIATGILWVSFLAIMIPAPFTFALVFLSNSGATLMDWWVRILGG